MLILTGICRARQICTAAKSTPSTRATVTLWPVKSKPELLLWFTLAYLFEELYAVRPARESVLMQSVQILVRLPSTLDHCRLG